MTDTAGLTKEIEAILYIASRVEDPTILRICKVLYFADLKHMQKYGRFISNDNYVAMKNGPVPSKTYDFMKGVRGHEPESTPLRIINNRDIVINRAPDLDEFSETDEECLNNAIEEYGNLPISELIDKSHDPAWDEATNHGRIFDDKSAPNSAKMRLAAIVEMFSNADELKLHLERSGYSLP